MEALGDQFVSIREVFVLFGMIFGALGDSWGRFGESSGGFGALWRDFRCPGRALEAFRGAFGVFLGSLA